MALEAERVAVLPIEACSLVTSSPEVRAFELPFSSPTKDTFAIALTDELAEQDVSFVELDVHGLVSSFYV